MTRIAVHPGMLRWARERAHLSEDALITRFPKLAAWEALDTLPTLRQLENYAKATLTPIGYLFLSTPPKEDLPIPDFRTMADQAMIRPSPNLLETIYVCQRRQTWYQEYARAQGVAPLSFIGSATIETPIEETAAIMRKTLAIDLDLRRDLRTWEEALRHLISQADAGGIMVMCSGVVLNNNHRKLDPEEFRGFAISDQIAPLVFINGSDTKSAQMFTLGHELAHLWLGQTALSSADIADLDGLAVERWCNRVAAEFLVPLELFRSEIRVGELIELALPRHARRFKVSTLVVLRRLLDAGAINQDQFSSAYRAELARLLAIQRPGTGGNFYLSQGARISKRFARAVVESTLEGRSLYRDAMRMIGVSKVETFNELGRSLGYPI